MTIRHFENVSSDYDVIALAHEGQSALFAAGHSYRGVTIDWSDEAFVIYFNNEAAGILTFTHKKFTDSLGITLGYVRSSARGMGLYSKLWNRLVEHGREKGIGFVTRGTHANNTEMQAIIERQGGVLESIGYDFKIPKD